MTGTSAEPAQFRCGREPALGAESEKPECRRWSDMENGAWGINDWIEYKLPRTQIKVVNAAGMDADTLYRHVLVRHPELCSGGEAPTSRRCACRAALPARGVAPGHPARPRPFP